MCFCFLYNRNGGDALRRDSLQIPLLCSLLDPFTDHLPDAAGGHSITLRELFAGPSLYEVERYDAPLNILAVLPGKHGNLRGKADTAIPDCYSNAGETVTRYAVFRTGERPTYHTQAD